MFTIVIKGHIDLIKMRANITLKKLKVVYEIINSSDEIIKKFWYILNYRLLKGLFFVKFIFGIIIAFN